MANGTSSGCVAHQAMMLFSFISSSAIALISTSSASTTSGSLMNLQHRTNRLQQFEVDLDHGLHGHRLALKGAGREVPLLYGQGSLPVQARIQAPGDADIVGQPVGSDHHGKHYGAFDLLLAGILGVLRVLAIYHAR